MKPVDQIPCYAPDGTSRGFRSLDSALRLVSGGFAKPSYGRKRHLKAIWFPREDGSDPVETHARAGTRYSVNERLEHGRAWDLKRLGGARDGKNYAPSEMRGAFLQVVADCLVK